MSLVLRKPGEDQNGPTARTVSLTDLRFSLYGGGTGGRYPQTTMASRATGGGLDGAMAGAMYGAADRINAANNQGARRPAPRRTAPAKPTGPVFRQPPTNSIQVIRGTEGSNYEVGNYGS